MLRLVIWPSLMLLRWTETKLWTLKYGSKSIQMFLIFRRRPPKPYKLLKFSISFVTTVKSCHVPTTVMYYLLVSVNRFVKIWTRPSFLLNFGKNVWQAPMFLQSFRLNCNPLVTYLDKWQKNKKLSKVALIRPRYASSQTWLNPTVCSITIGIRNCLRQDVWIPLDSLEMT